MVKLSLIFTALRVYRQARGKETTTWRGIITGTLAAGTIIVLGYFGAELSAEQIGIVLATTAGIDAILKIVLPDQIGGGGGEKTNTVQNIGGTHPVGVNSHSAYDPDRLRDMPASPEPGQPASPDAETQHSQGGLGGYNGA